MLVRLPQSLVIAEYFNYDRSARSCWRCRWPASRGRSRRPSIEEPGSAAYTARNDLNLRSRITLDDGLGAQNPPVLRHPNGQPFSLTTASAAATPSRTRSACSASTSASTASSRPRPADYTAVNPRPAAPRRSAARCASPRRTRSTSSSRSTPTTSDTGPGPCGGNANLDCRGADADQPRRVHAAARQAAADARRHQRRRHRAQRDREHARRRPARRSDRGIVPGLNALLGAGTYASINTGVIGTDAIKVGLIYKPAKS